MVRVAMGGRWATYEFKLSCFMLLILVLEFRGCFSLNSEGLALLAFRSKVTSDPFGAFVNWNADDTDPCLWSGVHCAHGVVRKLDLNEWSLGGVLAAELGNLNHLKSLVLSKNNFFGVIPKQFGWLACLEVLDLRNNSLSGTIPSEIGWMHSLRKLLLSNNNFEGSIPFEIGQLDSLSEMQFDVNLAPATAAEIGCINRKVGHCEWPSSLKRLRRSDSILTPIKQKINHYFYMFPIIGKGSLRNNVGDSYNNLPGPSELQFILNEHNLVDIARRKLVEQSSNLAALPYNGEALVDDFVSSPSNVGSGSFLAIPSQKNLSSPLPATAVAIPLESPSHTMTNPGVSSVSANQPSNKNAPTSQNSAHIWKYIVGITFIAFLLFAVVVMLVVSYGRATRDISPWKTGLSGQLQKAFVTGVPKLNSAELETACEDFSNIVQMQDAFTIYKGTLSSGVEIAVASTTIVALKDWTKRAEAAFRKKIASLSRVNHKNFVNLIGYCEEDEPFIRTMVFEYAPNGSLFEHLHVKELEHLDWSTRMRIIMGVAYCLQHMHGLNPPMVHSNLNSKGVYLTDDYAAKIAEVAFWEELVYKSKISREPDVELPPLTDAENDVYCFGLLLFEIISGKYSHLEGYGSLLNSAAEYLKDKQSISYLIDPTLKCFKDKELETICEVIQECTHQDPRKRPTMTEVSTKLRDRLDISPASATPRLSPLWWAELEILSSEAA